MAYRELSHESAIRRLEDKISELEKENTELKERLEKLEHALSIALDLLLK
jgi:prefoldin subunit 5